MQNSIEIKYTGDPSTEAEQTFFEDLGSQLSSKFTDAGMDIKTKKRTIIFRNLTKNQQEKLIRVAREHLPFKTTFSKFKGTK